jgi:hypothetical protein
MEIADVKKEQRCVLQDGLNTGCEEAVRAQDGKCEIE